MYFDEAFDADERRLLVESIVPAGNLTALAPTPFSWQLKYALLADRATFEDT